MHSSCYESDLRDDCLLYYIINVDILIVNFQISLLLLILQETVLTINTLKLTSTVC